MNLGEEALGSIQLAINEPRVEDQLLLGICDLRLAPRLDLALHRLEVSLHSVNANRHAIDERERLRVFREHRSEDTK
jgi:hypothetical protein